MILLILAGAFAVWQVGIFISAVAMLNAGARHVTYGAGPGIIAVTLLIIWALTL